MTTTEDNQGLALEVANRLGPGDRLRVSRTGLRRHDLEGDAADGTYVSQFASPRLGRMVVVRLPGRGSFGFLLEELELVERAATSR